MMILRVRPQLVTTLLAAACPLLVPVPRASAQADYFEGFNNNGPDNGQDGPENLISRGWIFRNQSEPTGDHGWFDGYTFDQWPRPQEGSGYLAVDSSSTDFFGGTVSNWAILPPVPNQIAGDAITFYARDEGGNNINRLQVRYSPSGGTNTGSGANDTGDFTTVLLDLNPIPTGGWNQYSVTLPGSGRIAFRYYIGDACNSGCFSSYSGIDSLSIGEPPPPPCNLPPIPTGNETVFWTAAGSPYEVCENISIPPSATVIVEPGTTVNFDQNMQLVVSGTLQIDATADSHAVFTYPSVFPPMLEVLGGTVNASFAEFEGQVRVESGADISLDSCEFRRNGLIWAQELQPVAPHVVLRGCLFDNTYATLADALVELRGNTFLHGNCTVLRGYGIVADGNTFTGGTLAITREETSQPFYVDGVHADSVAGGVGLALDGGNYLLGPDIDLHGNRYPLSLAGGLLPQSNVPTTGNTINAIDVGNGGFRGPGRWPDLGLPYRVTDPSLGDGGDLLIDPGVTVESVGDGGFALVSTRRLIADGTPASPITFRAVNAAQPWQGLIFQANSSQGPRLEYCTVLNAKFGTISTDNQLYVDNCLFQDNLVGSNCNTFGSTSFRKTRFLDNQTGVSMTDLGTPLLHSAANPNSFTGNTQAINALEPGSSADARRVWWGDPSGPQAPQNPGGQGDPIVGPGAANVTITPFLTEAPNDADTPPVVRMQEPGFAGRAGHGSTDYLLEPGAKYILRWDAQDDGTIVSQRIEFSPDGHYDSRYQVLVGDIPGDARSWEFTVPNPGFAPSNQPQFLRIVAVDDAGQEAWDQVPLVVPSGRLQGDIQITTDLSGQTFYAGQDYPTFTWTGTVNDFPLIDPFIVLESDGTGIKGLVSGGQAFFFGSFPNISTDRARLAIRARNNSNDVVWFFADGYFSVRHDPRLGLVPPTADLTSPADGAAVPGGTTVPIRWTAEDDEGLYGFDVQASYDGGRAFHTVVQDLPSDARSFDWKLPPSTGIADVRVRVIARDIRFQNSSSTRSISIEAGDGCTADFNGDGGVDTRDVLAFLNAWTAGDSSADVNGDGVVDTRDVLAFLNLWNAGC